jgi:phage tail protein X
MTALSRSLVALVVVAAGVALAIPFQRPSSAPTVTAPPRGRTPQVRWRDPNIVLQIVGGDERSPAEPMFREEVSDEAVMVPPDISPEIRTAQLARDLPTLPRIPAAFENLAPVNVGIRRSLGSEPRRMREEQTSRAARKHVIRNGDTLPHLARRYYGDADKWRVIFNANRNRLQDADLLPLDLEIDIPAEPVVDGHQPASQSFSDLVPFSDDDLRALKD